MAAVARCTGCARLCTRAQAPPPAALSAWSPPACGTAWMRTSHRPRPSPVTGPCTTLPRMRAWPPPPARLRAPHPPRTALLASCVAITEQNHTVKVSPAGAMPPADEHGNRSLTRCMVATGEVEGWPTGSILHLQRLTIGQTSLGSNREMIQSLASGDV